MIAFQNIFLWEETYKQLKFPAFYLLSGLSNQQGPGYLLYTCQLIYDPNYFTLKQNWSKGHTVSGQMSKGVNRTI